MGLLEEVVRLYEYWAAVLPKDKAAKVKQVQAQGDPDAITSDDVILARINALDVGAVSRLSRATYRKKIRSRPWATGYNAVALPLAGGARHPWGALLTPASGAVYRSNAKQCESGARMASATTTTKEV